MELVDHDASGTRVISFPYQGKVRTVRARVMEEFETEDGELEEISKNYIADCNPMHDVYYFGEDVFDGDGKPLPDAWLAGKDGARPGILMPDRAYLLGSRYFQEFAPNAKDRGEHTSMGFEVDVPAGLSRTASRSPRPRRSSRVTNRSRRIVRASVSYGTTTWN